MKKIVFAIIVVQIFCSGMLKAQRPVGDTIFGVDSTFFYYIYNWHEDTNREWGVEASRPWDFGARNRDTDPTGVLRPCVHGYEIHKVGNVIYGVQMYTERPLKVVGIAAPAYMQEPCDTVYGNDYGPPTIEHYLNTRDTTLSGRATDSMILYKPVDGDLVKLMDGPWRIEDPHRYISLPPRRWAYDWYNPRSHQFIDSTATSFIAPLYEVMFEKPVVVEDSFVVAITAFNNEGHRDWEYDIYEHPYYMWLWDHNPTRVFFFHEWRDSPTPGLVSWAKLRTLEWRPIRGDNPIQSRAIISHLWEFAAPVVLPIIEIDFDTLIEHCHPVENVRLAGKSDSSATLMWDASNSVRWEVKYGIVGQSEDDYRLVSTSVPTVTLTGLHPEIQYRAYVRGWCDCDSSYTEWSNRLLFTLERMEGEEHPGIVGRYTRLIPNPARGVVNVVSSFRLSRIEVYDLSGRKVLEQEADGISTMVDVRGLSSGTYIAALYLPHGVATKKLVVE